MQTYLKHLYKRAWKETWAFMGWELKKLLKILLIWSASFIALSILGAPLTGKIDNMIIAFLATLIVFPAVFIFYLLRTPSNIYHEQQDRIISLQAREKRKVDLQNTLASLQKHYNEAENFSTDFHRLTVPHFILPKKIAEWRTAVLNTMEDCGVSASDIHDFKNSPYINKNNLQDSLSTQQLILHSIIKSVIRSIEKSHEHLPVTDPAAPLRRSA